MATSRKLWRDFDRADETEVQRLLRDYEEEKSIADALGQGVLICLMLLAIVILLGYILNWLPSK